MPVQIQEIIITTEIQSESSRGTGGSNSSQSDVPASDRKLKKTIQALLKHIKKEMKER
jgi:hypothetical protein